MFQVLKRDGTLTDFNVNKISRAVQKAFDACNRIYNDDMISMITLRVISDFESKISDDKISVEEIQDSAEKVLSQSGYTDVSKAYILYRKQHENIRNIKATTLDYQKIVENYIDTMNWRIQENSTVPFSISGLILNNSAAITANYWLGNVYDEEISHAHRNGDIHIHHLNMLAGYRAGWSLKQLIQTGLGGVAGKISTGPAKHLNTICNQMINFFGIMQNEWASAQAFSHFDTYLSAFVKNDSLSYEDVKQCIQSFVYGINTPSRWGLQEPFSNISLDWKIPESMKDKKAIVGNREMEFCYGDCQQEMDMINRAFLETMMEGDDQGRVFRYPIPTYRISKQFQFDNSHLVQQLFGMVGKYGIAHFYNEANSHQLENHITGQYSYGENTGSIGLVTINLPRIAYLSKDQNTFFNRLDKVMNIAARSLEVKRVVLTKLLEAGFYPYTKAYLNHFNSHFSTIGVIGMNEVGLNASWLKNDLYHPEVQAFAKEVLNHMNEKLAIFSKEQGVPFNLEATLSNSAAQRFARHDLQAYPDIQVSNQGGKACYTESSQFVSKEPHDVLAALDAQESLQCFYTSGTLFEVCILEFMEDWESVSLLVQKIIEHYHLTYFKVKMKE